MFSYITNTYFYFRFEMFVKAKIEVFVDLHRDGIV
jgi:hypothetical protein